MRAYYTYTRIALRADGGQTCLCDYTCAFYACGPESVLINDSTCLYSTCVKESTTAERDEKLSKRYENNAETRRGNKPFCLHNTRVLNKPSSVLTCFYLVCNERLLLYTTHVRSIEQNYF